MAGFIHSALKSVLSGRDLPSRGPLSSARRSIRPRLEALEDRLVPATRTWDGGALSNNWSNPTNWAGNIAPAAGDDLVFPASVSDKTADNDFAHGTHFRSITLGGGYTLKGNRVFLGAGGVIDNSGASNFIKNDLDLGDSGGNRNFQIGTGSTLFLDGVLSGSNGPNKLGTGNLSFRANNTYTGITAINAGALFIEKDEGLGLGVAGTNIFSGATLVVNDQALGTIRTDETFFVQHNGTIRGINDVVLRGTISAAGNVIVRHDGGSFEEMKLVGGITGPGGVAIHAGTGRISIEGDGVNNYLGDTTVTGSSSALRATLLLKSNLEAIPGDLVINNHGEVLLKANQQIRSNSNVTINGTGFLNLDGKDDSINNLFMNGGKLQTVSDSVLLEIIAFFVGRLDDVRGGLTFFGSMTLTSSGPTLPARMIGAFVYLDPSNQVITVLDGPAANDAVFEFFYSRSDVYTKQGQGVLLEQSPSDYFRNIVVNQGTLKTNVKAINTRFTVHDDARIEAADEIYSLTVHPGGRVKAGTTNGTATLKIEENLTLEPGAIVEAAFNGTIAGSQHDQFDVDGSVNIDGAILEATLGANAAVGQTYKLINNNQSDAILGAFFLPPITSPFLLASPTGQRLAFNYQGGLLNNDLVLALQNTPPRAPGLALNTTEINEGGTVTATGSLVDPDARDRLRLFINWGDGSRQEVHRPGRDPFSFTHRYRQDGVYTARFEWIDQTGQGNRRSFTVTVHNVAPVFTARTFRLTSADVLLLSGWLGDAGTDRFFATLDFGDGSPIKSKTIRNRDYFALPHKYKNPGTYLVTLHLRDAQGAESTFQREVTIS